VTIFSVGVYTQFGPVSGSVSFGAEGVTVAGSGTLGYGLAVQSTTSGTVGWDVTQSGLEAWSGFQSNDLYEVPLDL
tara:strand:- start:24 stop:251 length:228 start_codon:yes stop_codon:yes gene_type:complete